MDFATIVAGLIAQVVVKAEPTLTGQLLEKLVSSGLLKKVGFTVEDAKAQIEKIFGAVPATPEKIAEYLKKCGVESGANRRAIPSPQSDQFEQLDSDVQKIIGDPNKFVAWTVENANDLPKFDHPDGKAHPARALDLIETAFNNWIECLNIHVRRRTDEGQGASIVIKVAALDGTGSKLAEADVGSGPVGQDKPYGLVIDVAEQWSEQKFVYALTHEIGHLLGLEHQEGDENKGDIMYPVARSDFPTAPVDVDKTDMLTKTEMQSVKIAQGAWGAAT